MSAPPQLDPLASTATPTRIVPGGRRARIALGVVAALLLGVLLPPYINVNRFQRRITASISQSLGRPVHLDHVTLNLLPVPGFTLDNFVVSEDPAFGAEPIIRASSVRATLRVSSVWRRPIEFSTIRFADPTSINLVHLADGRWNLDSILLQAARIETAPTAQATAGRAPRFPYIEATGARINLKLDQVKTPFSLTEGDLSLWLPSPQTWHLRIAARPARTDVPSGYPGLLRLDGTLGRARTLSEIPIDLQGEWRTAPLGEVSRILLGRDAGMRGEMTLDVAVHGTLGLNEMQTRVHVDGIRRASFVPQHLLSLTAVCSATIARTFHSLAAAECAIPPGAPGGLTIKGSMEDIRHPAPAALSVDLPPTSAAVGVELLQTLSFSTPPGLIVHGMASGSAAWALPEPGTETLRANLLLAGGTIAAGSDSEPIAFDDVVLRTPGEAAPALPGRRARQGRVPAARPETPPEPAAGSPFALSLHTAADLGGRERAAVDGHLDAEGYTVHLSGTAIRERLDGLAKALPQFGDGLGEAVGPPGASPVGTSAVIRLDHVATRAWGGVQTWSAAEAPEPPAHAIRHHRRRQGH